MGYGRSLIVREFVYGLILGIAAMYSFEYFDAPGVLAYLNSATASAVKSTSGYGGSDTRN
jgi:hypothetical protein